MSLPGLRTDRRRGAHRSCLRIVGRPCQSCRYRQPRSRGRCRNFPLSQLPDGQGGSQAWVVMLFIAPSIAGRLLIGISGTFCLVRRHGQRALGCRFLNSLCDISALPRRLAGPSFNTPLRGGWFRGAGMHGDEPWFVIECHGYLQIQEVRGLSSWTGRNRPSLDSCFSSFSDTGKLGGVHDRRHEQAQ